MQEIQTQVWMAVSAVIAMIIAILLARLNIKHQVAFLFPYWAGTLIVGCGWAILASAHLPEIGTGNCWRFMETYVAWGLLPIALSIPYYLWHGDYCWDETWWLNLIAAASLPLVAPVWYFIVIQLAIWTIVFGLVALGIYLCGGFRPEHSSEAEKSKSSEKPQLA